MREAVVMAWGCFALLKLLITLWTLWHLVSKVPMQMMCHPELALVGCMRIVSWMGFVQVWKMLADVVPWGLAGAFVVFAWELIRG